MVETLCYSNIMHKVKSHNTPDIVYFTVIVESFKFHTELPINNFVFTSVLIDLQYLFFTLQFFMLKTIYFFIFAVALRPNAGHGLLILEASRSHTTTHHRRYDSSGGMISSSQRLLPDNTQHSQQTNIHAFGGTRTHNLSMRAAADLVLRPRGHWDRQGLKLTGRFYNHKKQFAKYEHVYIKNRGGHAPNTS
jgi:hypothetical protein